MKKFVLAAALLSTLTACQSTMEQESKFELVGQWKVESIAGKPVIDYSPAQINFMENNELTGNNSCNNFFGSYSYDGQSLTLNPAGATMKACVDSLMAQERLMQISMMQVQSLKMEQGVLQLLGEEQQVLFTLTQM